MERSELWVEDPAALLNGSFSSHLNPMGTYGLEVDCEWNPVEAPQVAYRLGRGGEQDTDLARSALTGVKSLSGHGVRSIQP